MEISIEGLSKTYGTQKAVDDISFRLRDNEVLGFLGPNGAGKSTTMRIITCFIAPTNGEVKVNNVSVFEDPVAFKHKIGYLPENNPLYPDMFIYDYLHYMALLQSVPKNNIASRTKEVIDYAGLWDEKHKKIGELSKGFRQRVGLAQALIHDPEVLILDEPTSGLDPNQIIEIRELIKNLGKEKTILLSTHILQEVEATCDRIIIINKGKIVADATPGGLQQQITQTETLIVRLETGKNAEEVSKFLTEIPLVTGIDILDPGNMVFQLHVNDLYQGKKLLFDLCVKKGWYLMGLKETETKLEDVFRMLTSNN